MESNISIAADFLLKKLGRRWKHREREEIEVMRQKESVSLDCNFSFHVDKEYLSLFHTI